MVVSETLSASLEDYLEAIYHVVAEKQAVRAKDIASRLKVSRSSVTGALHALARRGLINYAPYDVISLTLEGRSIAGEVIRRHETLRDFFIRVLAIDEAEAEKVACKMEHVVSPTVLERFIQFVEFVETCPRGGTSWIKGFGYYCADPTMQHNCERCISLCLEDAKKRKPRSELGERKVTVLRELTPGQKAKIVKIKGRGATTKRIADMGVTPGTLVEVERIAPLGDPIEIKVKGYHLSLRKEEAERISVEPL